MRTAATVGRRTLLVFALPATLFVIWWLATERSQNFYLPPLRTILSRFGPVWTPERLRADVLPSVLRLACGYGLAAATAVALGLVIGSYRLVRAATEPVLEFFRAVPPPVLVPVIMLFAGIGDTMKVIVIASGCVWPVLLNTVEGVRAVDLVLGDEMGDAMREHPGLARAGAGHHEQRPAGVDDGIELIGVQPVGGRSGKIGHGDVILRSGCATVPRPAVSRPLPGSRPSAGCRRGPRPGCRRRRPRRRRPRTARAARPRRRGTRPTRLRSRSRPLLAGDYNAERPAAVTLSTQERSLLLR